MNEIETILDKLRVMSESIGTEVRGEIEYCPDTGRVWIPDPDVCLTVWTVLSIIEAGLSVNKDWLNGDEIMVIKDN